MNIINRLWSYKNDFGFNKMHNEDGYIGIFPYLLILRSITYIGIAIRFVLHHDEYNHKDLILLIALLLIAIIVFFIDFNSTVKNKSKKVNRKVIIYSDILLISIFYFLTRHVESDFFLFYYLPLLTASEYLIKREFIKVFITISLIFFATILFIFLFFRSLYSSFDYGIIRIFFPREIYFLFIALITLVNHKNEKYRKKALMDKNQQILSLVGFRNNIGKHYSIGPILKITLGFIIKKLHLKNGYISYDGFLSHVEQTFYDKEHFQKMFSDKELELIFKKVTTIKDSPFDSYYSNYKFNQENYFIALPLYSSFEKVVGMAVLTNNERFKYEDIIYIKTILDLTKGSIEKSKLITGLHEISLVSNSYVELNNEIDEILNDLTNKAGFEFASISLVDDYRYTIEAIKGINIPFGLINSSKHNLNSKDIQADIIREKKTEIICGFDSRLDKDIYEKYGHDQTTRIFQPLVYNGNAIGTIEAGFYKKSKDLISKNHEELVIKLAESKSERIANARPHVIFKTIANHAITIIDADSASLHVYHKNNKTELFLTSAGKVNHEFLKKNPPREDGLGYRALKEMSPIYIDNSIELRKYNYEIYNHGIRAIAALPLTLNNTHSGVLYIHFWRIHKFTSLEKNLLEIFVKQMNLVIYNTLLIKKITEENLSAWSLTNIQNILSSISTKEKVEEILDEIANNICRLMNATNVTLYKYNTGEKVFYSNPLLIGKFLNKSKIIPSETKSEFFRNLANSGKTLFFDDVNNAIEEFYPKQTDSKLKDRFYLREGIKSCAIIFLKDIIDNSLLGIMFINFDYPNHFSEEKKRMILTYSLSASIALSNKLLQTKIEDEKQKASKDFVAKTGHALGSKISSLNFLLQMAKKGIYGEINPDFLILLEPQIMQALRFSENFKKYSAIKEIQLSETLLCEEIFKDFSCYPCDLDYNFLYDKSLNSKKANLNIEYFIVAIEELISNSIKYANRKSHNKPEINLSINLHNNRLFIEVKDNGTGIEKEFLEEIFLPFHQAGLFKSKGIGLGLALVKDVVIKHNGEINVISKPNIETIFSIAIPLNN